MKQEKLIRNAKPKRMKMKHDEKSYNDWQSIN